MRYISLSGSIPLVGVEFEPTARSAPLECDAAMKIKVDRKNKKRESF